MPQERSMRAFVLALPEGDQQRNAWQSAIGLMLAATDGGDIEAATEQIGAALSFQMKLKL